MSRICLVALIGLPGAGKTSLSKWLMQQQAVLSGWNVLHVCYDDYFQQEYNIDTNNEYKKQRQGIYQLLTELIEKLRFKNDDRLLNLPAKLRLAASTAVSNNYLIICDDNHYYRSMRHKLYQLCRDQSCIYAQIHLDRCLTDCLLANEKRGAACVVPESVIHQMQKRLEAPSDDAWASNSLTLTNSDFNAAAKEICNFIESLLRSQVAAVLETTVTKPQLQSLAHHLDLQLRARIRAQMQHATPSIPKQILSRTLNEQRKQILTQFRHDIRVKLTDLNVNLKNYVNLLI